MSYPSKLSTRLIATKAVRGTLVVTGLHHEKNKYGRDQLICRCTCGKSRICDVSTYNQGQIVACKDCVKEKKGEVARSVSVERWQQQKAALQACARPEQVKVLLAQRIAAHQRLEMPYSVEDLERDIKREVAVHDYSDLLLDRKFTTEMKRGCSLTDAVRGGSGL